MACSSLRLLASRWIYVVVLDKACWAWDSLWLRLELVVEDSAGGSRRSTARGNGGGAEDRHGGAGRAGRADPTTALVAVNDHSCQRNGARGAAGSGFTAGCAAVLLAAAANVHHGYILRRGGIVVVGGRLVVGVGGCRRGDRV